jgi:hypothetical protein
MTANHPCAANMTDDSANSAVRKENISTRFGGEREGSGILA